MYSMLAFCALWAFAAHQEVLGRGHGRWPWLAVGAAADLGLMYLHGAAPLMLACVYVAALFQTVAARPARATLLRWLAVRAGVALLATPAIARALAAGSRDASGFSYTVAPGASEVLESLARLLLGPVVGTQPAAVALAAALLGVLAVLGILNARLRPLAAGYLLAPVVLGVGASHLLSPVWHERLIAFTLPLLAWLVARLVWGLEDRDRENARPRTLAALVALVFLAACALPGIGFPSKPPDLQRASRDLRNHVEAGDALWLPHPFDGWTWAWIAAGPERARRLQSRAHWRYDGVDLYTGRTQPDTRAASLWLIRQHWHRAREVAGYRHTQRRVYQAVIVEEWQRLP